MQGTLKGCQPCGLSLRQDLDPFAGIADLPLNAQPAGQLPDKRSESHTLHQPAQQPLLAMHRLLVAGQVRDLKGRGRGCRHDHTPFSVQSD